MNATSCPDATDRDDERGAVLVVALVVLVLAGTIIAALLVHVQAGTRSARNYRARTDRISAADNAVATMIAIIRRPAGLPTAPTGATEDRTGLLGLAGASVIRTVGSVSVSCLGEPGSGAAGSNGTYADRTVTCTATGDGRTLLTSRLLFVDENGTSLGRSVQQLSAVHAG